MSNSLRDQLVKAGLASKQQADAVNAKARKKRKKPRGKSASDIAAEKAAAEKRAKDRELSAALQAKQERAAIKGQIKVLIESAALKEYRGEEVFNYVLGSKIRQIFVNAEIHRGLSDDRIAITRLNGNTFLVPTETADKVLGLNPDWAVARPGKADDKPGAEDDPYADYQVPDDLNW